MDGDRRLQPPPKRHLPRRREPRQPHVPFSQFDSQNPEELWRALDRFQKETGGELLAIPHNGNLSNGRMSTVKTFDDQPLTREVAETRARLEPLIEVTQIKGDGEAHPFLSPDDEFADYETWDRSNLNGTEVKTKDMLQWEYAREALKTGLMLEKQLGVNPTSSAWSGARTPTPRSPRWRRTISSASTRGGARAPPLRARRDPGSRPEAVRDGLAAGGGRLCRGLARETPARPSSTR